MSMQIHVRNLEGKVISIDVQKDETIISIKKKLLGVVENQRIIFGGKQLEDNSTLADANVQPNQTLHLVMRVV